MLLYVNGNLPAQPELANYLRAYGLLPTTLQHPTVESEFNYMNLAWEFIPTPEDKCESYWFEFPCDPKAYSDQILQTYLQQSAYEADLKRRRLFRKLIRSTAVSMAGHLSFLVPRYKQVCLETTAKEEVIHYEGIILAEEMERLNPVNRAIQKLTSGWRLCTKRLHSLSILATHCWRTFYGSGCINFGPAPGLLA